MFAFESEADIAGRDKNTAIERTCDVSARNIAAQFHPFGFLTKPK